jgi:uncharacterized protein involved in outer membrane biogenesis
LAAGQACRRCASRRRTTNQRSISLGRIFVFFGGLIVLALTAALVGPYFVDWSSYRADFEREASRVLGHKVTVEGAVSVRLLPFPSVSFSDIRVGASARDPVMTIKTFSMDAEIAPLLSGQVLIYDMRIESPHVVLTVDRDGTVDWAIRSSTLFDPRQITLEKVTLSGGEADIVDKAAGKRHRITGVEAIMSASTLAGPWHIDGTATLDGRRATLSISTNDVKANEPLRVHARIQPEGVAAVVETDGELTAPGGKVQYAGTLDIRSSDLVPSVEEGEPTPNETPKSDRKAPLFAKVHVTGQFKADHSSITLQQFRIEQGRADDPYVINGKASVDFGATPGFSVTANGQQVLIGDADAASGRADKPNGAAEAGTRLAGRLNSFNSLLASIPVPDIPGKVRLNLPAVIVGGTTIRDIAVDAEPAQGGWLVSQFTAGLPGRTQVEASGKLVAKPAFRFDGHLLVASLQPSGLSTWLTGGVDEAVRRLAGGGFSADVSLDAASQRFDNLEIDLGPSIITGSVVRHADGEGRPSLKVNLHAGALGEDSSAALKSFFVSDAGKPQIVGSDLDVTLSAGPVAAEGLQASSFDTAFRLSNGRLDLDRLTVTDLAGASLSAKGGGTPFGVTPAGSVVATLRSPDLGRFLAAVAARFPNFTAVSALRDRAALYPGLFQDTELSLTGAVDKAGDGLKLSMKGQGRAGGTSLTFDVGGSGAEASLAALDLDVHSHAHNATGETLLALMGLPALPLQLIGGLDADVSLKGRLPAGAATQLSLTGPDTTARLDGTLALAGGKFQAQGKAHLKSTDLESYLAVTGHALPGFGDGLPAELASGFSFKDGALTLSDLTGTIAGNTVRADLAISPKDGVPDISGRAAFDQLDLSGVAAFLLGPEAMTPGADGQWSKKPFAQSSSFPLGVDVTVSAGQAELGTAPGVRKFSGQFSLHADDLRISALDGRVGGGRLGGLVELRNTGGTALLSTQFTLDGADLGTLYTTSGGRRPLGGTIGIAASLNGTGKSLAALVASLSGSGSVAAKELTVVGLDPAALRPILAQGDAAGPDVQPAQLAAIVGRQIPGGRFDAGSVDLPFTVAAGVLRFSGVRAAAGGSELTTDLRADIGTDRLEGSGSFAFDPGKDGVSGATPSVGFNLGGTVGSPIASIDPQPMTQFLTQRALEREQQRVEAMQAALLEKQRLRREVSFYEMRAQDRTHIAQQAAQQRAAEAAAMAREAVQAERQKAADAASKQAALEAARQQDAARKKALQDAQQRAILDAQRQQPKGQGTAAPAPSPGGSSGSSLSGPASGKSFDLLPDDQRTIDNLMKSLKLNR